MACQNYSLTIKLLVIHFSAFVIYMVVQLPTTIICTGFDCKNVLKPFVVTKLTLVSLSSSHERKKACEGCCAVSRSHGGGGGERLEKWCQSKSGEGVTDGYLIWYKLAFLAGWNLFGGTNFFSELIFVAKNRWPVANQRQGFTSNQRRARKEPIK